MYSEVRSNRSSRRRSSLLSIRSWSKFLNMLPPATLCTWSLDLSAQPFNILFRRVAHTIACQPVNAPQFCDQYIGVQAILPVGRRTQVIYSSIIAKQQID